MMRNLTHLSFIAIVSPRGKQTQPSEYKPGLLDSILAEYTLPL